MPTFYEGQKFNKWCVVATVSVLTCEKVACVCECGSKLNIVAMRLLNNGSTQCSKCGRKQAGAKVRAATRADHCMRPAYIFKAEYRSWSAMLARCHGKVPHKDYGLRGIFVCDTWRESFLNFIRDMGPRPTPAHSIDRINVNGAYTKENCRWATKTQQARNRRDSLLFNGAHILDTLAERGITYGVARRLALKSPVSSNMDTGI